MKAMTVIVLFLMLLAPPSAISQVPDDKLIVPGQRIGRWALTMTIADLRQMNGPPNRVVVLGGRQDLATELLVHFWDRLGFQAATSTSDRQRVEVLVLTSDEFKTERGISVNSRREAVETAYGRPTAETHAIGSIVWLIYDEIGLGMTIVSPGLAGELGELVVFRPGTGRQVWRF